MPTTLTGLLLFVVLLLPGFAYLVGKERHGTERRLSPFRETVAIVAASVTSELFVLTVFAGIRALWPSRAPDVVRSSVTPVYLRSSPVHYGVPFFRAFVFLLRRCSSPTWQRSLRSGARLRG